jgi:PAS domain S-box-containing protein
MASGKPKLHAEELQTTLDGKQTWFSTTKVPLRDADGAIIGVLGIYEDITHRKWAEEEIVLPILSREVDYWRKRERNLKNL